MSCVTTLKHIFLQKGFSDNLPIIFQTSDLVASGKVDKVTFDSKYTRTQLP